jgi:hypothetical protein
MPDDNLPPPFEDDPDVIPAEDPTPYTPMTREDWAGVAPWVVDMIFAFRDAFDAEDAANPYEDEPQAPEQARDPGLFESRDADAETDDK